MSKESLYAQKSDSGRFLKIKIFRILNIGNWNEKFPGSSNISFKFGKGEEFVKGDSVPYGKVCI